jgi:hypothetical protein
MPQGDDRACSVAPVALEPGDTSLLTPDEVDHRPIHRGPSIFHPPRPTSPAA